MVKNAINCAQGAHWEAGLGESSKKSATGAFTGRPPQLPLEYQQELELFRQHGKKIRKIFLPKMSRISICGRMLQDPSITGGFNSNPGSNRAGGKGLGMGSGNGMWTRNSALRAAAPHAHKPIALRNSCGSQQDTETFSRN